MDLTTAAERLGAHVVFYPGYGQPRSAVIDGIEDSHVRIRYPHDTRYPNGHYHIVDPAGLALVRGA